MAKIFDCRLSMTLLLPDFVIAWVNIISKSHTKRLKDFKECFEVFEFVLSNAVNHSGELEDPRLQIWYDDHQLMKDNVKIGDQLMDVGIVLIVEAAMVADRFLLELVRIEGLLNELQR